MTRSSEALKAISAAIRKGEYRSERRALKEAKARCRLVGNKDFGDYGGRGISVCAEWCGDDGIELFLLHMGRKPSSKHTLDRIDNDGNYEPGNVQWATRLAQNNNRRSSKFITWRRRRETAAEWGRLCSLPRQEIANRINQGWPVERALTEGATPIPPVDGESLLWAMARGWKMPESMDWMFPELRSECPKCGESSICGWDCHACRMLDDTPDPEYLADVARLEESEATDGR